MTARRPVVVAAALAVGVLALPRAAAAQSACAPGTLQAYLDMQLAGQRCTIGAASVQLRTLSLFPGLAAADVWVTPLATAGSFGMRFAAVAPGAPLAQVVADVQRSDDGLVATTHTTAGLGAGFTLDLGPALHVTSVSMEAVEEAGEGLRAQPPIAPTYLPLLDADGNPVRDPSTLEPVQNPDESTGCGWNADRFDPDLGYYQSVQATFQCAASYVSADGQFHLQGPTDSYAGAEMQADKAEGYYCTAGTFVGPTSTPCGRLTRVLTGLRAGDVTSMNFWALALSDVSGGRADAGTDLAGAASMSAFEWSVGYAATTAPEPASVALLGGGLLGLGAVARRRRRA